MATPANGKGRGWRKGKTKYTAEEIEQFCINYFTYCKDNDRKPTIEGLAHKMDITSETLLLWMNADNSNSGEVYNPDVSEVLKKARDYISDELQQQNDSMSIFRLKQPRYGGYTDKQQIDASSNIVVEFKIRGVPGV